MDDRKKQVVQWRDEDKYTFREIGERLSVSASRARQLYRRSRRTADDLVDDLVWGEQLKKGNIDVPIAALDLDNMTSNSLRRTGFKTIRELLQYIAIHGMTGLQQRVRNFGIVRMRELEQALLSCGLLYSDAIDSNDTEISESHVENKQDEE